MSLSIAKYIKSVLSADKDLTAIVGDRMYPIVATEGTNTPFIVYQRASVSSTDSKDGVVGDTVTSQVVIVSDDYDESLEIAELVRRDLSRAVQTSSGVDVDDAKFTAATEDMVSSAYVQILSFEFSTY